MSCDLKSDFGILGFWNLSDLLISRKIGDLKFGKLGIGHRTETSYDLELHLAFLKLVFLTLFSIEVT